MFRGEEMETEQEGGREVQERAERWGERGKKEASERASEKRIEDEGL